jgi:hypothetical protein
MNQIKKIFDSFKDDLIIKIRNNINTKSLLFKHKEKFVDYDLIEHHLYNIFLNDLHLSNYVINDNSINNKITVDEVYDEYMIYDKEIIKDAINDSQLSTEVKNKLINNLMIN